MCTPFRSNSGRSGGPWTLALKGVGGKSRCWRLDGVARVEAVLAASGMSEAEKSARCRAKGFFPSETEQWRRSGSEALAQPAERQRTGMLALSHPPVSDHACHRTVSRRSPEFPFSTDRPKPDARHIPTRSLWPSSCLAPFETYLGLEIGAVNPAFSSCTRSPSFSCGQQLKSLPQIQGPL